MSNVATSCTIAAYTGWPSGSDPFYVVISPGTAAEEKVLVTRTGATDTTLNVVSGGRGSDDTTAQAHDSGAAIYPVFTATDANQANLVASTQTTKGDLLVHTGSAHARVGVGTNGHALIADSAETAGVKWAAIDDTTKIAKSIVDAKGDLIVATADDTPAKLTVGSNGTLLVADSGETPGVKWSASVSGLTVNNSIVQGLEESWNVAATAATGTVDFNTLTSTAWLYTSNASGNWTLNVRGDGSTTLASLLDTGDSITVVFAVTNGATAYYSTAFQIDGNAVTPEWQGGAAPAAGNASSIDVYVYTIVKTAATPTYTVLASQTQFA
jgi:hypothetical protein